MENPIEMNDLGGTMIFGNIKSSAMRRPGVSARPLCIRCPSTARLAGAAVSSVSSWQMGRKEPGPFKGVIWYGFSMVHYQLNGLIFQKKWRNMAWYSKTWINILQKIAWYYKKWIAIVIWYLLILVLAFFSCCSLLGKLIEFVSRGDAILCVQ